MTKSEPSKVSCKNFSSFAVVLLTWNASHVLVCCRVTGNLKSAQGAVKETLGAAVGAKQMESEGTRSCEDPVSFHPDNLVCCLVCAEALRADRRQGYPCRGQH